MDPKPILSSVPSPTFPGFCMLGLAYTHGYSKITGYIDIFNHVIFWILNNCKAFVFLKPDRSLSSGSCWGFTFLSVQQEVKFSNCTFVRALDLCKYTSQVFIDPISPNRRILGSPSIFAMLLNVIKAL